MSAALLTCAALAFAPSHFFSPAPSVGLRRSRDATSLLTLGEDGDPFADNYPPAVVEAEITRVRLRTTAGDCEIVVDRAYSPEGVDRFLELVEIGFFTDMLLYRVLPGFLVQFGCAAEPAVQAKWQDARLPDEPNRATFRSGTLSYAGAGANSSHHFPLYGRDRTETSQRVRKVSNLSVER